jgi:methionyl-tRNA formyltransferase
VNPARSLLWHILSLYPIGAEMIRRAIERIDAGDEPSVVSQRAGDGAYFTFPTTEDLVRFTAAGWRLFDRGDLEDLLQGFGVTEAGN